MEEHV